MTLLDVRDLRVVFPQREDRPPHPVDGVSFTLDRGEALALVGESGSGKSLTALAIMGLLPAPGKVDESSSVLFQDQDLTDLSESEFRSVRGGGIGLVFQDPGTSLNPLQTGRAQIVEAVRAHRPLTKKAATAVADELLGEVGFPAGRERAYPHQLSGGLRQRVMIAIALAGEPDLLIADEPTSALDVTVQAQILELIDRLRETRGMALMLITHDLSLVSGRTDRVVVMYAGQVVETGPTSDLFSAPAHPYTRGLLAAIPRLDGKKAGGLSIQGALPRGPQWPAGCRFHSRCPVSLDRCSTEPPPQIQVGPAWGTSCWLAEGSEK